MTQKSHFSHPGGSYTNICLSVLDSFYFSSEIEGFCDAKTTEPVVLSVSANPVSLYTFVACG